MKNILLYLWQLPQNLLGLAVIKILKSKHNEYYGFWYTDNYDFGVSLGKYIIFGERFSGRALAHERGHQKQSLYLGWLYLIVIGLPSVVGNLLNRVIDFDYYKQPWEAWADRLGCVVR